MSQPRHQKSWGSRDHVKGFGVVNEISNHLKEASDSESNLILTSGEPARLGKDHGVRVLNDGKVIGHEDIASVLKSFVSDGEWGEFVKGHVVLHLAVVEGAGRFRLFAARCRNVDTVVFHPITDRYTDWEESWLPESVNALSNIIESNVMLVSGQNDSGRTTTVARIVRGMTGYVGKHVVMLEKCPEFMIDVEGLVVTRLEKSASIGNELATIHAMRPDVVLIDELETFEDLDACVSLAEEGVYVIGVARGITTVETLNRLMDLVPTGMGDSFRSRFSQVFGGCIAQVIVKRKVGDKPMVAAEVCIAHHAIRSWFREGKQAQIPGMIAVGEAYGMTRQAQTLFRLVKGGVIELEEARRVAEEPYDVDHLLKVELKNNPPDGSAPSTSPGV